MGYNPEKGASLIELLTVIMMTAVLAASGGSLTAFLVRNTVYIPNQLNVDMTASDILGLMIDGDARARGLRFSRAVTEAQPYRVSFINQDHQTISYELLTGQNRFVRSVAGGEPQTVPYYAPLSGITVSGKDGRVFAYYGTGDDPVSRPEDVRRIVMSVAVASGSGSYDQWEGCSEQVSSVGVRRFEE